LTPTIDKWKLLWKILLLAIDLSVPLNNVLKPIENTATILTVQPLEIRVITNERFYISFTYYNYSLYYC
jgi:uncharacterized membrane protein